MLYPKSASYRRNFITDARATNYGVVRLELIEHIYEHMYDQRRELGRDDTNWPHRIMGGRKVVGVDAISEKTVQVRAVRVEDQEPSSSGAVGSEETWEADIVIAATGYKRDAHLDMLRDTWSLLPKTNVPSKQEERVSSGWTVQSSEGEHRLAVGRNYQVQYKPGTIETGSGVWLQGCCEATHGVSDYTTPQMTKTT